MPLNVAAAGNRPLFPPDRDCEDHVYCIIEFPAPGYDPKDPIASRKKIGVQYASINGNGFGGYGEIVYGTKGTLVLEKEQDLQIIKGPAAASSVKASGGSGGPTMDTQASGAAAVAKSSGPAVKVSRGYTEELEHWAWCIRHPAPENEPRCPPKIAMGDAIIALTTNMAARKGERIEFKKEWFDIDSDETPEGVKPDVSRYKS
jgi:predicted dehydrogenase